MPQWHKQKPDNKENIWKLHVIYRYSKNLTDHNKHGMVSQN